MMKSASGLLWNCLAVDHGSSTVAIELVDRNTGAVIDRIRAVKAVYGTDILTRIKSSVLFLI